MKALIKKLTEAYGPSGFEDEVRAIIEKEITKHVDEVSVDSLGNLIALKKGDGTGKRVLIAAHMDEIGLMASHIDQEGFVRFAKIGGVFPLHLTGLRCKFANGTIGVIYSERTNGTGKVQPISKHYIDVGATSKEDCPVNIGDPAIFWEPCVVQGNRVIAKSLDDRIGCVTAIETLKKLKKSPHDVYFVFTVQEEVGLRGATVAGNRIAPDVAIALDVTATGDTPKGIWGDMAMALGAGPTIKIQDGGFLAHHGFVKLMKQRADEAGIPYQPEILVGGSTDAKAIQLTGVGSIAGVISIPTRYVHAPSEIADLGDVAGAVSLLTAILEAPIDL